MNGRESHAINDCRIAWIFCRKSKVLRLKPLVPPRPTEKQCHKDMSQVVGQIFLFLRVGGPSSHIDTELPAISWAKKRTFRTCSRAGTWGQCLQRPMGPMRFLGSGDRDCTGKPFFFARKWWAKWSFQSESQIEKNQGCGRNQAQALCLIVKRMSQLFRLVHCFFSREPRAKGTTHGNIWQLLSMEKDAMIGDAWWNVMLIMFPVSQEETEPSANCAPGSETLWHTIFDDMYTYITYIYTHIYIHTCIYIYIPAKLESQEKLQLSHNRKIYLDSCNSPVVPTNSRNGKKTCNSWGSPDVLVSLDYE